MAGKHPLAVAILANTDCKAEQPGVPEPESFEPAKLGRIKTPGLPATAHSRRVLPQLHPANSDRRGSYKP